MSGNPRIIEITNLDDPEVAVFHSLTEKSLGKKECGEGLFIAESPKVIRVAIEEGYEPVSLLCERKHISGDAADIISSNPGMPVYTGVRELLAQITGYKLTRGVLCAMKRKPQPSAADLCEHGKIIAVLESVCDTTNIGSIFRSATALGIDAVLLTPDSCDPFNRRAVRVSMGTVFKMPWAFSECPVELLKTNGFTTVALTLHEDSITIDDPVLKSSDKIALVLGTEGDGLSKEIISKCHYKAIIPMYRRVDSLNVGAAAAVAFWELRKKHS